MAQLKEQLGFELDTTLSSPCFTVVPVPHYPTTLFSPSAIGSPLQQTHLVEMVCGGLWFPPGFQAFQEAALQDLFLEVGKSWPPRLRTKKSADELNTEEPAKAKDEKEAVVDAAPLDGEPVEGNNLDGEPMDEETSDGVTNGSSTPSPKERVLNDEYLAWTLGGELRATPSPGPPNWEPATPKEKLEFEASLRQVKEIEMTEFDIDQRLRTLENLGG